MKLLVLLISLAVLHYLTAVRPKLIVGFKSYVQLWIQAFGKQNWFQTMAGPLAMLVIPIFVINLASAQLVTELLVSLLVVMVCLNVTQQITPSYMSPTVTTPLLHKNDSATLPKDLWLANYRYVTPLFWYLFLGPTGLIVYTFLLYAALCPSMPSWQNMAQRSYELAAWIPSRIMGLAYALSGDLKPTLKIWGELLMADYQANHAFLVACATTAHQAKPTANTDVTYQNLVRDAQILLLGLFAVIAMLLSILIN